MLLAVFLSCLPLGAAFIAPARPSAAVSTHLTCRRRTSLPAAEEPQEDGPKRRRRWRTENWEDEESWQQRASGREEEAASKQREWERLRGGRTEAPPRRRRSRRAPRSDEDEEDFDSWADGRAADQKSDKTSSREVFLRGALVSVAAVLFASQMMTSLPGPSNDADLDMGGRAWPAAGSTFPLERDVPAEAVRPPVIADSEGMVLYDAPAEEFLRAALRLRDTRLALGTLRSPGGLAGKQLSKVVQGRSLSPDEFRSTCRQLSAMVPLERKLATGEACEVATDALTRLRSAANGRNYGGAYGGANALAPAAGAAVRAVDNVISLILP